MYLHLWVVCETLKQNRQRDFKARFCVADVYHSWGLDVVDMIVEMALARSFGMLATGTNTDNCIAPQTPALIFCCKGWFVLISKTAIQRSLPVYPSIQWWRGALVKRR